MATENTDPHKIKEGEIQITSNGDIETIVTECSSPEETKFFGNYGAPNYPINFYRTYYDKDDTKENKDKYVKGEGKTGNKMPLWIYVNSMYDAGYKLTEAEKFINTQCNTIKNNITETFKNIQNFSKPEVDTICDKWPIDDSYLIRKSIRGSFIYTYILQQLFVESMLEWNSIMGEQATKICELSTAKNNDGEPYSSYASKTEDGKIKPNLLIKANWFGQNATEFSYDKIPDETIETIVAKSLGCLQQGFAEIVVDKYINGDLDSIKVTKDVIQAQLIKAATSDANTNVYKECTERNKKLVEKVKEDLYGTTFSDGKLEKELDALIDEIEGTFWSASEATKKQTDFELKCTDLGFKATNKGTLTSTDKGTQISDLDYEVDDQSTGYANQLLKGVEDAGGFTPPFGIVGNYDGDGVQNDPLAFPWDDAILIEKGVGANEAYINETNALSALAHNSIFGKWAQFKTTNAVTVAAGGYVDKRENYVYGTNNTPIKKKPNGLVDWENQDSFNIISSNTYPHGDFNFIQKLKKDLISIQRKIATAENKPIGSDFELIYGDKDSANPDYYIGPLSCHDCLIKNYYETFGYNGMPESVKNSEKFITNRLNKLFTDFSKSINTYLTASTTKDMPSPYDNTINASCAAIFKRINDKEQPVFTDNIFDGLFIGDNKSEAIIQNNKSIKNIVDNCPKEKTIFSLLVYWLNAKEFPMDNIQFWENNNPDKPGTASGLPSIFFTEVVEWIKYDILDTLQKWGSAFKQKTGSFDLKFGNEVFNDLICSPAGILIASVYANKTLQYANEDTSEIKNSIMKILNTLAVVNILEKIIIKNLDVASINKYVVYKLIELAEGKVSFVNPPKEETINDTVEASQNENDLRQPARYFNAENVISLTDYNWGPVYNLEHTKIDPNSFSRLILWEFQPAAVSPTKLLVAAGEQLAGNAIDKVGSLLENATGEKVFQGIEKSNGVKMIPDAVAKFISKNDKVVVAGTRWAGSAVVDYQLNSLANDPNKEDKVLGIDWIKNRLPGKWVGQYEIPFFNNSFMKSKTKESWSMGNALSEAGNILSGVRDGFQLNVQDVPVWDFNKDPQEGINWSTSFFLINDNIGNVKKNISFLMSFAAGSYWLQINGYQYHCPNLYRVECPGRFFELYTSLDILVQYYGKTRKVLKSEAGNIFGNDYKFKLFNELLDSNQLFIPEAYEIKIDSKSLQPNAFNIQYNYFIKGAKGNRPTGIVNELENSSGNDANTDEQKYKPPEKISNINSQLETIAQTIEDKKEAANKAKAAEEKKKQEEAKKKQDEKSRMQQNLISILP